MSGTPMILYHVAKFDNRYPQWGLTSQYKKIGKARSEIENVLKLQVWDIHWIIVYALQFLPVPIFWRKHLYPQSHKNVSIAIENP